MPAARWAALAAVLLAGCLASEGPGATLSASEGSSSFVIYLVLENGALVRSEAWWANEAPQLDVHINEGPAWEAIVLKNDVAIDRAPILGTADHAFLVWDTGGRGVGVNAGDRFEVLVVNTTSEDTMATFEVSISP